MSSSTRHPSRSRAYTLIETLVAASILMIGVSAAAAMSLSFVTQEEINERAMQAFNHLENAARLYQIGMEPDAIAAVLPADPNESTFSFESEAVAVDGLGQVPLTTVSITYRSTGATQSAQALRWTGGDKDTTRTRSVRVLRAPGHLASPLPRLQHFQP